MRKTRCGRHADDSGGRSTFLPELLRRGRRVAGGALALALLVAIAAIPSGAQALGTQDKTAGDAAKVMPWLSAVQPAAAPTQLKVKAAKLALTGVTLWHVKAVDENTDKPLVVTFDANGKVLADGGHSYVIAEKRALWKIRGGIRPGLWSKLKVAPADTLIPVGIWLRSDERTMDKTQLLGNVFTGIQHKAARDLAQATAKVAFGKEFAAVVKRPYQLQPAAPLVTAALTPGEIRAISKLRSVGWIDWRQPRVPFMSTTWVDTMLAAVNSTGVDGSGEAICLIERYQPNTPNNLTIRSVRKPASPKDEHARAVAGALRSSANPNGTASGAFIDISNFQNSPISGSMAYCAGGSVLDYVWNFSYNCDDSVCQGLVDYYTTIGPYPLITIPAGNTATPPGATRGTAYNALAVGGTHEHGTSVTSDDTIWSLNADANPTMSLNGTTYTDWELPNVVAPAYDVKTDGFVPTVSAGTSLSSAMVAGVAAQIHETNANLKGWPEAVRSILMCSADEDVDDVRLDLDDAVDDRDGAGEVNATLAIHLANAANQTDPDSAAVEAGIDYAYLSEVYGTAPGVYQTYYAKTTSANKRLRVVLTWNASATCTNWTSDDNNNPPACAPQVLDADIDIYVYKHVPGGWALIKASFTYTSNYEFVEIPAEADTDYKIEVFVAQWYNSSTYYGISWNFGDYPS